MTIDLDPVILHAGPLMVSWYGVAVALAIVVGSWLALREARRKGLPSDRVESVAIWVFALYLGLYAFGKFALAFLRTETVWVAGLQEARLLAVVAGALAVGWSLWPSRDAMPSPA